LLIIKVQEKNISLFVKYPSLSYDEAQKKVQSAIAKIADGKGVPYNEFFLKMFTK